MTFSDDLKYVTELARSAGKIARDAYGKVERLTKTHAAASAEAVTEADRATQRHIVAGLRKRFPTDGIIGEESDSGESITFDVKNPTGRNWVIDPIDGTNNFIAGLGLFCVCIGLLDKGYPILGAVYDVTRDQMYFAGKGESAWLDSRKLHVLETPLDDAGILLLTSNVLDKSGNCPKWAIKWLAQTAWKVRILGSAALEAVNVAAGVAHGAVTVNGKLWDVVAPAAIVLEAGGLITSMDGKPVFPFNLVGYAGAKVPYISAGAKAHEQMMEDLRS
ncbi:MAG TPA: inositol monophosphatase [Tepidisphaeraceae bacterium]|nr:inositol monophosphatase [Tepidisphaeraceae bacterium]